MENEEEIIEYPTCTHCGSRMEQDAVVCYQCGSPTVPGEEWEGAYEKYRTLVVGFFSINLFVCLIFNFWPPASETITGLMIVDGFLFLCAILYAYRMRELIVPLLSWNRFSWWRLLVVVIVAVISAVCVNYGVKWINRSVFDRELYYYIQKKLQPSTVKITTIARGISFGGELEYADEMTLARSLQHRMPIEQLRV